MNPVAMTNINPRKEYWQSWGLNQPPPVLKSAMLPTELWVLAKNKNIVGIGENAGDKLFCHLQMFSIYHSMPNKEETILTLYHTTTYKTGPI